MSDYILPDLDSLFSDNLIKTPTKIDRLQDIGLNLSCENRLIFDKYVNGLKIAIQNNTYEEYIQTQNLPKLYYEYPSINRNNLSEPYYDEIPINSIKINNGTKIPIDFEDGESPRVTEAIAYILENKCQPLSVIKSGGEYYITNGRHRFYAHILLQKEYIPVSVEEIVEEEIIRNDIMIEIVKPYDNDGEGVLAYPEKALDFYDKYRIFFDSINRIEMKIINGRHKLSFFLEDSCDVISFYGCCTAGNNLRSSLVTCELIKRCGYLIDMQFISTHNEFELYDKRDAHNINFDSPVNLKAIEEIIVPALDNKQKFKRHYNEDILLLRQYVMENSERYFDYMRNTTRILKVDDKYFYIVGLEDKNDAYIYIFEDDSFPFDSLSIKFLGFINKSHVLYKYFDAWYTDESNNDNEDVEKFQDISDKLAALKVTFDSLQDLDNFYTEND